MARWTTLILTLIAASVATNWLCRDSTIYAPGYSWSKYCSIRNGMTPEEVTRILGQPLSIDQVDESIHWDYTFNSPDAPLHPGSGDDAIAADTGDRPTFAYFTADLSGTILSVHPTGGRPGPEEMVGKSLDDVRKRYGAPPTSYTYPRQTMYWYSQLRNIKGEYVMAVHFDKDGKVYQIDASRIGHYLGSPGNMPRPSSLIEWLEWYAF